MVTGKKLDELLKIYTVFHKPFFIPDASYLNPIHAGKAVSAIELNMDVDNYGENISALNPKLCELTVLYNVWKNKKYLPVAYWGLCHYRRYFTVNIHWTRIKKKATYFRKETPENFKEVFSERLSKFLFRNLDPGTVILPVATDNTVNKVSYNIKQVYCSHHDPAGWEIMGTAIEKLHPDYSKSFEETGQLLRYHPFNMMIAHHTVWEKYLPWLFSIVFYIYDNYAFPVDPYQSRAIGFMGERLLTIYFYHHRHEYKIVNMPVASFTIG